MSSTNAKGRHKGTITPGALATLIGVPREAFATVDQWQEALQQAIDVNQQKHRPQWPQGQEANDGLQKNFWVTKFYYVEDKMEESETVQTMKENITKEGELSSRQAMEFAFGVEDNKTEEGPKQLPAQSTAGLKRGRRALAASQNLATLIGKATASTMMEDVPQESKNLLVRLSQTLKALRDQGLDTLTKDELDQHLYQIENMHDDLAAAFPDLAQSKKKAKRTVAEEVANATPDDAAAALQEAGAEGAEPGLLVAVPAQPEQQAAPPQQVERAEASMACSQSF